MMPSQTLLLFRTVLACVVMATLASAHAEPAAPAYDPDKGSLAVETYTADWKDPQRDRTVPVKIYYPKVAEGKCPVILFSHGLGGSRDGYAYLGQQWASRGYVVVHVQHVGSDSGVWKDVPLADRAAAMRRSAANPENSTNRPRDITFAIDQLQKLNEDDPVFKQRLDLDRIGMAGHSFGGYTTLAVIGETFILPGGREISVADPRIKAAISMSAPVPKNPENFDRAFAKISIPCLHMTGTLDNSPIGDTKAAERRVPFDHIPATADQYLIIFTDGDHMIFSGRTRPAGATPANDKSTKDAAFQDLIRQSTTAFWETYLRSDAAARHWLEDGPCKNALAANGTLEMKLAKSPAAKP